MKLLIHSNQFDGRGSGKIPLRYAKYLRDYNNHEITFITSKYADNSGVSKIEEEFGVKYYDCKSVAHQSPDEQKLTNRVIEKTISELNTDFIYFLKSGQNDNINPGNCRSGIHCIFNMEYPHGNVYAGVSEYLAKKFNRIDYVPHIVEYKQPNENFRKKLGISNDMFVVGRHGGSGQFNIPFVHRAVEDILKHRKDIFFLFLSTDKFINDDRVLFLPHTTDEQEIFNFIDACDVMLHGRNDGETFGMAVAEFSVSNKPVMTWSGLLDGERYRRYDTCHIDLLGDKAIIYNGYSDLLDTLYSIDGNFIKQHNWDKYSIKFSPKNVINKFSEVFLNGK